MGSAAKMDCALRVGTGSSSTSWRTTTLASTSMIPADHFARRGPFHPVDLFGFALRAQATHDFGQNGSRKAIRRPKQNSVCGLFDCEFRARSPGASRPNGLGQDDLPFGGKPRGFHGKTPV